MRKKILIFLLLMTSISFFSQTEKKEKFKAETLLHLKIGTTLNLNNQSLLKDLNGNSSNAFSFAKPYNFNPLAEVGFEFHFAKYLGLNINLGFTQTRLSYNYHQYTGDIISNIPHVSVMPTLYFKNTRLMVGTGLYKYYFTFNPLSAGPYWFNLNIEGMAFYNKVSIMQLFKIKSHQLSITGSYFGFMKKFDSGFQLAVGFVL